MAPQAIEQLLIKGIKARSDSALEERAADARFPPHSPISQFISMVLIFMLIISMRVVPIFTLFGLVL